MKTELSLTDKQTLDIRPIIKITMKKRQAYLKSIEGDAIINKVALRSAMKKIRSEENEALSKILSPDQMKMRIDKQRLKERLNQDQDNYTPSSDEGTTMSPAGPSFQF